MRVIKFYKKKCSVPGHAEEVVSVFPPSSPHLIYDYSYWNSDSWDAAEYGVSYNPKESFFSQFKELYFRVPQCPLDRDPSGVNSEYSVGGLNSKNAYFCAMSHHAEDIAYCLSAEYSRNCMDLTQSQHDELCYEAVSTSTSNRSKYVVDCADCMDSSFLFGCRNCSYCFMSSNLRNRSYVFQNRQMTREEYRQAIEKIDFGSRKEIAEYRAQFDDLISQSIHKAVWNINSAGVVGNQVMHSKNCYFVFNGWGNCEDIRFADNVEKAKDCMDIANAIGEKMYSSVISFGSNISFSISSRRSTNLEYCVSCHNSHYCFGCVGLKSKRFHIFNRPYEEEEYWVRVDELKSEMLKRGEYGKFFPYELHLFPYQSSAAGKWFPLSPEEARQQGIAWYDEPESISAPCLESSEVPDNIRDVKDDILEKAIRCEASKKLFRIIPSELAFYRANSIPLPIRHPLQRLKDRGEYEHAMWLYPYKCSSCSKEGLTAIHQQKIAGLRIYCEECYQAEMV
jgi:hypothetical protein